MTLFRLLVMLLIAAVMLIILASCASKPLIPDRPQTITVRKEVKKEISNLNIPIEIKAEEMAKILDSLVPQELFKGSTMTAGMSVTIRRKGPIEVTAADDFISFRIPTAATATYFLINSPDIPLNLSFKTKISVTPDWKYNAETHYTGFYNLIFEEIGVGSLSIKPRSLVENALSPLQKLISDLINKKLNEKLSLKAQVEKAWQNLYKPILVDKNNSAWLKITPQEVTMYPLTARNNLVQLSIGFKTFAEVVVGPQPAAEKPLPLANLKPVNAIDKKFTISLFADLFYSDLVKIAANNLLNKELEGGGHKIRIVGLDLYGNGEQLVIKADLKGDVEGVVYLTGKPKFDKEKNFFSVEELEFDVLTQSMLLNSAEWLLHGTIRSILAEKLKIDLSEKLEQARQLASKAMEKQKLVEKVYLKGEIKTLKINDLYVGDDRISVQIFTEGETGIIFQ